MMHTKLLTLAISLTLLFSLFAPSTEAGTISTDAILASYTVKFSEKEAVLITPNDPLVELAAAWDSPFQRIVDRNMPWIEITNEGESTAQITQFVLTIGDTDFNFSTEAFGAPVLLSTTNPADVGLDASIQSGGDLLVVNLTDFDPGQTVRFRIDIGSDDPGGFPHPDFRRVLFDMNGNNPADNAEVELQFSNGITTRLEQQLPDFAVAGPIFFESLVRPKAAMEPVGVFTITNRQVIPEPSTWLVATLVASIAAVCAGRTSGMAQEGQR